MELPPVFKLTSVTEYDVLREVQKLKITKSSAIPNVSTKILKDAFEALVQQLTFLFNLSIFTCNFPTKWKCANVTPLFKTGDPTDVNNYRPISQLPTPSKILEHLIHTQVTNYFDTFDILDSNQGGFRKNHSTTATTSHFLDDIYVNINNQKPTLAVFIDFKKAFDSVNHNIILKKLKKLGLHPNTIDWFRSYLASRTQITSVNQIHSDIAPVTCGVPQGSVLGPLLFLIFINDLGSVLQKSSYKLYADDTVIYTDYTKTDTEDVVSDLQADLTNLNNWCKMNEICINISKSKSMVFGTRYQVKHCDPPNVTLGNIGLEIVPHYKYLGTFVDSYLTFTKQAAETCKSVSFKAYCLSKIKKYLNSETMIKLYKAYIQPYFDYNDIFNSTSTSYYQSKLIKLQQRCLRNCLPATKKYEKLELHILTGVNSLKDRAESHLLKIMYKRSRLTDYLNNDP